MKNTRSSRRAFLTGAGGAVALSTMGLAASIPDPVPGLVAEWIRVFDNVNINADADCQRQCEMLNAIEEQIGHTPATSLRGALAKFRVLERQGDLPGPDDEVKDWRDQMLVSIRDDLERITASQSSVS